ncbi:formate/nitrite transporter family protein [Parasphaerochaeta coccoides]|uniref:Formate/nitrite transporter n=1 Tax=Parasphaerochaeta coccoides (strain ATCC BAA-1237 / DSM 17374 / SPN1) TaxID=760011 RepID=F4GJ38_PARC1|nr:formate/nitrite transporter family protein [Parasphaerochaeta coccoides]AEC01333.1 formate/nitrite transporter [Parasphaerochaeta coccoides DSM 17374]
MEIHDTSLNAILHAGEHKVNVLGHDPAASVSAAMLAGVFVGLGMFLIYTIGGYLNASGITHYKILMGVSFGIALSLVMLLDGNLFTGNTMLATAGLLAGKMKVRQAVKLCVWSWLGNFAGSTLLAILFLFADTTHGSVRQFFIDGAMAKMTVPAVNIFFKGVLCNFLVCFATLSAIKLKEETARLIMIFWCLFAFITTGYEHSVANMSFFSAAWLLSGRTIPLISIGHGLLWSTVGNAVGGILVAVAYYVIGRKNLERPASE